MIEILEIEQRCKPSPVSLVHASDFVVRPGGYAEPDLLVRNPHLSPYCLDDVSKRVLFVETPPDVALATYPFFYEAQYQHAQRLVAVPYATMVTLGEDLPARQATLALIYSPGRSGSTLLSKAFQETGMTVSLSEPDIYTQVVALRAGDTTRDAELTALLTSTTKLLFKPASAGDAAIWVVKFRSFCIEGADLLNVAFPAAKSIFLCRDLGSWIPSLMRIMGGFVQTDQLVPFLLPLVPLLGPAIRERGAESLTPIEMAALGWLSIMRRYIALIRQGMPLYTLRFEDMVADPRGTLTALFGYVGLDEGLVDAAIQAFDHDSQEGSVLGRAAVSQRDPVVITDAEWARVRALVQRFPLPAEHVHVPLVVSAIV